MNAHDFGDRRSIAVVGAGVAGLTAAYVLAQRHDVTLYEADDRLGGHAHTHDVTDSAGNVLAVDTGFIVHNDRTYPHLRRLFGELGVRTRPTEMSMSIHDERSGVEFAGGRGAKGVFAQPRRALDPRVPVGPGRRSSASRCGPTRSWTGPTTAIRPPTVSSSAATASPTRSCACTRCRWCRACGRWAPVRRWTIPPDTCSDSSTTTACSSCTARRSGTPCVGGSRTYVEAIGDRLPHVRAGHAVSNVLRHDTGVSVQDSSGTWTDYDAIVIATHADQALDLLADASREEKEVLGAFRYSRSETVLHTDARLLPTAPRARASWNYLTPSATDGDHAPIVTYWMNRLQGLDSSEQYLVTLNARDRIDPAKVIAVMDYEHPIYDLPAIEAQARLASLSTPRIAFAGAYHGWGFHEDGCRSGVEAARSLGVAW